MNRRIVHRLTHIKMRTGVLRGNTPVFFWVDFPNGYNQIRLTNVDVIDTDIQRGNGSFRSISMLCTHAY